MPTRKLKKAAVPGRAASLAIAVALLAAPFAAAAQVAPIEPLSQAPSPAADPAAETSGALAVASDDALYRIEEITDISVLNALGEEIGEVEGYVVSGDRLAFARISIGGVLGLGGTEISIPFETLVFRQSTTGREATLEAVIETVRTQDQLDALVRAAPSD